MKFSSEVHTSSAFISHTSQHDHTFQPQENSYETDNNYAEAADGTISSVRIIKTLEVTIEVNNEKNLMTNGSGALNNEQQSETLEID